MRILYVIGMFYPCQAGGPSSAISWLVKFIHAKQVETRVVTTNFGIDDKTIIPNVWKENEFGYVCYHSFRNMAVPLRMILSAWSQLKQVDIVHLNSIFHPPSLLTAIVALIMKKEIFWDPGGELAAEALKYGRLKKLLYLILVRIVVRDKPYYHTTSSQETEDVRRHISKNARIFEAPNYIERFPKISCTVKKQLLFIGRLHPIKGIDHLIKAISLSENFMSSDFILVIAGDYDHPYGTYLKKLVDDLGLNARIDFIGHVTDEYKYQLYAESYFMILPSHSENFANVVTEALSQGTPVIASRGTPWGCLESWDAGYYCSNEPHILAAFIDRALGLDEITYSKYRNNAYDLLITEFSMEKGGYKWLEAYRSSLKNGK